MSKSGKLFYGWVIVAVCVIISAVGLGFYAQTVSSFVLPVCNELGFGRGEYTLRNTIVALVTAFLAPLFGSAVQKFGVKKCMLFSALLMAGAYMGYSVSSKLWHFYLFAFINGAAYNGLAFMMLGILINAWFTDKKGIATGIAYCGSGLGGAILIPIVQKWIENMGWRAADRMIAAAATLILIPVILLLVKNKPQDMGLEPYSDGSSKTARKGTGGITMRQAYRMPAFWALVFALGIMMCGSAGAHAHTLAFLQDIGYSASYASIIMSALLLVLTATKIVVGTAYDRFGTMACNCVLGACAGLFPLAALIARVPGMPWVYAVLYGAASTACSVPVSTLVARYCGQKDFPKIFSFVTMTNALMNAASSPLMGLVYDSTGSYNPAWILLSVLSFAGLACLIYADRFFKKFNAEAEK